MLTEFSITPSGAAILESPAPEPEHQPVKFNAAFIERRMAEHRMWCEEEQLRVALAIVTEYVSWRRQ